MTQQQKEEEVAVQAEGRQPGPQVNGDLPGGESPGQQVDSHQDERDRQDRALHPLFSPGPMTGWETGPQPDRRRLAPLVPDPNIDETRGD